MAPRHKPAHPVQAHAPAIKLSLPSGTAATEPPKTTERPPTAAAAKPAPVKQQIEKPFVAQPLPEAVASDLPASTAVAVAVAPAVDWRYLLLQNDARGQARLSWQPGGAVYTLRLERELEGRPLPGSNSQGRLDTQGLSPERFTQQRPGRQGQAPRDAAATNFRQGERQDQISFSASTEQVPMPGGVQDRISWWLQLAAIVAATPQQFVPGRELRMMVAGLRGEAREWIFEVLDRQDLALPVGPIPQAVHLRRAALGPYSGEIELWLDPARHHLPVRLLVKLPDERDWELQLLDEGLPQP
ncbi:DUF3108 domain-containing protein [Paucibacter sp. TC2R-5]|uniref:DUF3108 domain-containing protein n=1 Tax=Paucibacter sp. TC2R-5 TaxID=2893555 RepID=UPI0021E3884A|nr:DUF3108 domain-containing protein [Paucibacter sp. TC2R-5]MCV2358168.1 DUF3108 domain-containing protein [Paucibacter sp. TC2R-5]